MRALPFLIPQGSPRVPDGFFDWAKENKIPVLGICYGMQMLVHLLGGNVRAADGRGEYGKMDIDCTSGSMLYGDESGTQTVWMSHGDEAERLPEGFKTVAKSKQGAIVAIEEPSLRFFGLQYHPEVMHTVRGRETIKRFLFDVCGLKGDWSMSNVLEEQLSIIRNQVRRDERAETALPPQPAVLRARRRPSEAGLLPGVLRRICCCAGAHLLLC